jgi:hypothetical protein
MAGPVPVNEGKPGFETFAEWLSYNPDTGELTWIKGKRGLSAGTKAGRLERTGYVRVMFERRQHLAHRVAWLLMTGSWPEFTIDHINGDRADNRFVNLRHAKHCENMRNIAGRSPHGKGVHIFRGRYRAQIRSGGEKIWLGDYDTPEQARDAYRAAAAKFHGEYARFD